MKLAWLIDCTEFNRKKKSYNNQMTEYWAYFCIFEKKAGHKDRQRQEFDSEEHNPVRRVEEVSN
ncbi:hypothetical protein BIT28_25595 [Photobacterium proteolyticum]|uniref:Uncharacterized protein n=1 Tax=Photobacterium proteolyticum TaxID=1903952 RepID=A0A1Q9GFN4_9GAMM|nr:hypothetical protein BIT28_25595 [Photobacterium proteolyticum]